MILYLKYRPKTFGQIVGNKEIINSLEKMTDNPETCPHAILLQGETGCGKTTISRIIADKLGVKGADFTEMDSADFRGIDTVRTIRKQVMFAAREGKYRLFLMDECHKLTGDAQSALLKILEDTPKHVFFILATTDPQKLLKTIRGRCSVFTVKPLHEIEMSKLLKKVVRKEREELDDLVYEQIIQDAVGRPRNALQILDQVLRVDKDLRLATAKKTAEEESESIELCRALLAGNGWKKVSNILRKLNEQGQDAESIRRHVLGYANAILLKSENDVAALVIAEFFESFYFIGFPGLTASCYAVIKG